MDIGQRIRLRREELGMTQEELAKKLNYAGRSSVNKVENSREVSMKKIEVYAKALETTVSYLMGWEEKTDNRFSADTAHLVAQIRKDVELTEALKKYFSMSEEQKKHVIATINMISKE